ncbi:MAG: hypothetical protein Q9186_004901 [Xanthomendoza sp. 1 TL-2023]
MIWALHLPIRKRVGVMTIFATGSLVIELNIGLICACMPAAAAILRKIPSADINTWYYRVTRPWSTHDKSGMAGVPRRNEPDVTSRSSNSRYLELGPVDNVNSKEALMKTGGSVGVSSKTLEEGRKQSDDDDDDEKGRVGFNRAWYPG